MFVGDRALRILIFPKAQIAPALVPAGQSTVRYRPLVAIRLLNALPPVKHLQISDSFADPGSDLTVFKSRFLSSLGISKIAHQVHHCWKGALEAVRFCSVWLEILDASQKFKWPATVGFTDAPIPYGGLLGLSGFFEYFDVTFLGERQLEVVPSILFHRVGGTIT